MTKQQQPDSTRCDHCGRAFNTRRALNVHLEECPTLPFDQEPGPGDASMLEELKKWEK